jgi:catechol 2,3-dioxygenase-like lactoylglutathione lyase family enzyme
MPIVGLHHYSLTAPGDVLEEVVAFYGELLGLTPGFRPDFGFPGYWLYASGHPLLHLLQDDNRQSGETGYFDHIALQCEDLEQVIARLEDRSVEYFRADIAQTGQTQLFVRDPAGTQVELNFQTGQPA